MNLLHITLPTLGAVVIELTPGTIAAFCGCVTGVAAVIALLVKFIRWVDKQKKQDGDIQALQDKHDKDIKAIKHEQTLIVYGILAALKGLQEQGCNGPVTKAIDKFEKHLNQAAHDEVEA